MNEALDACGELPNGALSPGERQQLLDAIEAANARGSEMDKECIFVQALDLAEAILKSARRGH
jgi:hypothetical protein